MLGLFYVLDGIFYLIDFGLLLLTAWFGGDKVPFRGLRKPLNLKA
jgi:hypothetical protein